MRSTTNTHRRHARACAAITALVALTLGMLTACSSDLPPQTLTVGSVVQARTQIETTEPKAPVLLPMGKLVVRSGEPVKTLTADQTADHTAQTAPESGSFVPLRLTSYGDLFQPLRPVFGAPLQLKVTLVAGGKPYAITPPRMDAPGVHTSDMYVAVPGEPGELTLDIDYAGVTQTVDLDTGDVLKRRARLMERTTEYDLKKTTECPSERWTYIADGTVVVFGCKYTKPIITPYLDGKFSREGFAFVVVQIQANFANLSMYDNAGGRALFQVRKSKDHTRLGGKRPIKTLGEVAAQGFSTGFYAWRIEVDDRGRPKVPDVLHFKRKYLLDLNTVKGDLNPANRRLVTIEGDIRL